MRNNIGRPVIFWNTTVCILKGSEGPNNATASQDPQILHFPPIKFVIPTCKDMLAYESAGTADCKIEEKGGWHKKTKEP